MNGALSWNQCSDRRMPMPVSQGRGPAAIHFALPDRALEVTAETEQARQLHGSVYRSILAPTRAQHIRPDQR